MAATVGEMMVLDDAAALAVAAAERFCACLAGGVNDRGEAHVALTGGSSAVALYRELVRPRWRPALDWSRLHLWWGDERYVPLDHPQSNAGMAIRTLLEPGLDEEVDASTALPVPASQVHPMPVDEAIGRGLGAPWAAERHAVKVRGLIDRRAGGVPVFDLVLLGVGVDGHILSAFPGSPALARDAPLVMALPAPTHVEPHLARITHSPAILPAADAILVMVHGSAKARIVEQAMRGDTDPDRLPARLAVRANATWLLDRESAALLS